MQALGAIGFSRRGGLPRAETVDKSSVERPLAAVAAVGSAAGPVGAGVKEGQPE